MKPFPYSKDDIKHAANGNWQGIFTRMGVPQRALTNRHQPCPICGGKDRYRFDNKHGNGTYFCNQCGSGDGITFVMKWLQCSFPDALRAIAEQLGMTPATNRPISRIQPTPAPQHEKPEKDELTKLQHIWQETQPLANTPAEQYLRQRGLSLPIKTTALRYHAALPYWGRTIATGEPIFMGNYGAMVSAITDLKGELQGLHMTYINNAQKLKLAHPQTGELMPAKKMQNRFSGSLMGSAVHIDEISDTGFLMVAEGIETALAAKELFQSEKGVNLFVWHVWIATR